MLKPTVLSLIRVYQKAISPLLPPSCRFYPTCSSYTFTAIERFGVVRGGYLGLTRICRCHPWNPGGFDPVPDARPDGRTDERDHKNESSH